MFKLDEAVAALKGHDEFVVKAYEGVVCLDYILCFPGTFDASEAEVAEYGEDRARRYAWIRRNCRGMTFDEKTGDIVSLPLHKFFNVNQVADTQFSVLSSYKAKIYEKLDGSMIHFYIHPDGRLLAATCRSALTPQAQEALAFVEKNPLLREQILALIQEGYTPMFEFVAAHNQIVVQYPRSRLVYLISRHRETGEYCFHEGFSDTAQSYDFEFKDIHSHLDKEEFEGYVCHLENGMMVKAKTEWYTERHRAVNAWLKPAYKLYGLVYEGVMDDLIGLSPDWAKKKLTAIHEEAQRDLLNEKLRVESLFEFCFAEVVKKFDGVTTLPSRKNDKVLRKAFALSVRSLPEFGLLMSLYNGDDPTEKIKNNLMDGYKIKYPDRLFVDLVVEE